MSGALLLFLLIRIFSNPLANVFQKKLSYNNSPFTINLYTYSFLSILCIPFAGMVFSQSYPFYFWSLVFIAGLLCTLGMLFLIKAVNLGELSVIGPVNSYKSIVGLIASFIILKEIPSLYGLAGMFLIIWGSKYLFSSPNEKFSFNLLKRKDIQYRFLALLLTGIEAAILKKIIILSSAEVCFILWCFMGAFWSVVLILLTGKTVKPACGKDFYVCGLIALCLGLMEYSTNFVFERMNVGYALALFQLSSVVTVFLGYKFFREKNILMKLSGCIIMIIGSCLIILN